jgi:hypothetical protein
MEKQKPAILIVCLCCVALLAVSVGLRAEYSDPVGAHAEAHAADLWLDAAEGKMSREQCLGIARRRIRDSLLLNFPDAETRAVIQRYEKLSRRQAAEREPRPVDPAAPEE